MVRAPHDEGFPKSNRLGVAARLAGLFRRRGTTAEKPPITEAKTTEPRAETEKEEHARQKLVASLNATDFDFSKSFAASFRPQEAYVKFPAAEKVIYTSWIDVAFDAGTSQLSISGQKHETEFLPEGSRGRRHWVHYKDRDAYIFAVTLGADGTVENAKLPAAYGVDMIRKTWHDREDLVPVIGLQDSFTVAGYSGGDSYLRSLVTFMERGIDQVAVQYSDGVPPELPPHRIEHYVEDWPVSRY